jgi:DNA invertase Pin-like site-specific DNA recombinase
VASAQKKVPAVAYLRTSSATNVGGDKDSDKRQREAIQAFAKRAGFEIVAEFYDQAVSGKDPIEGRPGFKALLERIVNNGARVVIVEDASRFARHLLTQEAGISLLVGLGVRVMTAAGDDLTDSDDEFRVAMRQIMGVFSQLEKTRLVKKLKAARDRKRATGAKVEGRKSHAEVNPEAVALAKKLRRASPKTGKRRSLREISAELAAAGHKNEHGRPFNPNSIKAMLEGGR